MTNLEKLKFIDAAIADYTEMSKKGTTLKSLKIKNMELGLCYYFYSLGLTFHWSSIANRPKWKHNEAYGWSTPDYEYEHKVKNKRGIKDRLKFLIENRELIADNLRYSRW